MNKSLLDIDDDWLEPRWQTSVPSKLVELGDDGFLEAEGQELFALDHLNYIVSLSGSNPLHTPSMEHLARLGIFVYLDTARAEILRRRQGMRLGAIIGQGTKSLEDILAWREHIYERSYDIRILIGKDETPADIAKKVVEQLEQRSQFYRSTREDTADSSEQFLDVVQQGLAPDGGLYGK